MALQTSPPISLNNIKAEFGATGARSLTEFYRGGAFVPNIPANSGVPTSGAISLLDFLGAASGVAVLPLTPVTVSHSTVAPSSLTVSYTVHGQGSAAGTVNKAPIQSVATPNVLPEQWMPAGGAVADYDVRFTLTGSSSPDPIPNGTFGSWQNLSSNRSVGLTLSGSQNSFIGVNYRIEVLVEFAAAGTGNVIGSVPVVVSAQRTA